VDALANPSLQQSLRVVLVVVAAIGAAMFAAVLWSLRRPMSAQARVFRKRVGAVGLFIVVAAGAAFALLAVPVEPAPGGRPLEPARDGDSGGEDEVASERRFSSAKLPALSLDAPGGWRLEVDKRRKLAAVSDTARLMVSTANLTEAVDVQAMLGQLADTQRALGFEVGDTFTDRIGDLPAAGFLATGPTRSVCTWMIKRDTRLASSVICTAEGKPTAREACRAPLAKLRWRTPARGDR
jgi:hypothetical protein